MSEHSEVLVSRPEAPERAPVQQPRALGQPRVLSVDEVKAVAGGPSIEDRQPV